MRRSTATLATAALAAAALIAPGAAHADATGSAACYETALDGLTATPDVIDIDHSDLTVGGRATFRTSPDSAPQPAQGVTVNGPASTAATTGADGTFTLKYTGVPSSLVELHAQGELCATSGSAPLTVTKQATQVTAQLSPGTTVYPGTIMTVRGRVVRRGAIPASGVEVRVGVPADVAESSPQPVRTDADGAFRVAFTAGRGVGKSGAVTVRTTDNGFLTASTADLGTLTVKNQSELSGFTLGDNPHTYGTPIGGSVRLAVRPDPTNVTNLPVYLEYSPDGKAWTTWQSRTLARPGNFLFDSAKPVKQDGYWRARYPGSALTTPAVTEARYIDVKYWTHIERFDASPEPVKKGKTITVKGLLTRVRDKSEVAPNAPVAIYFKAAGSSTWTKVATTKTASNGWFTKAFTASKDGTWAARYLESSGYLGSNAPTDYVDVR